MSSEPSTIAIETAPPQFGREDEGRLVSADEFAAATYGEPWVYERVDGRLVVMSPDGWEHVDTSEPWRDRLGAYKLLRPEVVRQVVSQPWVRVDGDNDRIGDIGVYLVGERDRLKIPHRVPDLMFEFVSPSRQDRHRDYVAKRAQYERIGIREYVIVDRFDRRVTVLTLGDAGYAERRIEGDGAYESPLLPGLVVPLAEVWPR